MDLTSGKRCLSSLIRRSVMGNDLTNVEYLQGYFNKQQQVLLNHEEEAQLLSSIKSLIESSSGMWEVKAAGFCCFGEYLSLQTTNNGDHNIQDFFPLIIHGFSDEETRVRNTLIQVVEHLGRLFPEKSWSEFSPPLLEVINETFNLDEAERAKEHERIALKALQIEKRQPPPSGELDMYYCSLNQGLEVRKTLTYSVICAESEPEFSNSMKIRGRTYSLTSFRSTASNFDPSLLHETIGWKALESAMRTLQSLMKGCGKAFVTNKYLTQDLLHLIAVRSSRHQNRFVREVGYDLCATVAKDLFDAQDDVSKELLVLEKSISKGLGDNWSEVRYTASKAARNILLGIMSSVDLEEDIVFNLLDNLIPRVCLNRYYFAEGVRLYSQETWKLAFKTQGASIVAAHAKACIDFYIQQSQSNSHVVREASCNCIAELASRVDPVAIQPLVSNILMDALIECFRDESWQVRDASCLACGFLVKNFPIETKLRIDELYKLWFNHLSDNVWSVRADAAVALGIVMSSSDINTKNKAFENSKMYLKLLLDAVLTQPIDTKGSHRHEIQITRSNNSSTESSLRSVVPGNSKDSRFSDRPIFPCCSFGPRLKRGVGCVDHGFSRPKEPWESSDGAVYLLREMSTISPETASEFIPTLAEIAEYSSRRLFFQAQTLLETIWKELPSIAQSLGKAKFKQQCSGQLLRPLILNLESDHRQSAHAALKCTMFLKTFIGEGILLGRISAIEPDGDRLEQVYKKFVL